MRSPINAQLRRHLACGTFWLAAVAATALPAVAAEAEEAGTAARLRQLQQRFPEADLNRDGTLTEAEAREFQRQRKGAKSGRKADEAVGAVTPRFVNVPYGSNPRQVLDVWPADGPGPTPVLVFFHGGSFKAGDKSAVQTRPILAECLAAGITVVSANYRYTTEAAFPAPMHDGARAVQFVRARAAEWNIDPARVAVSGISAGATLALWIALHDDLADPASADPVARFSTRVTCASPHNGTAGLEPEYLQRHAGVTKLGAALFQLFGATSREGLDAADKRALMREASPIHHATADDPPLFLTYAGEPSEAPFPPDAAQSAWIHHVALGQPLAIRYGELGLTCELHHRGHPAPAGAEVAFLRRHLLGPR